jgi:hypothetical protein
MIALIASLPAQAQTTSSLAAQIADAVAHQDLKALDHLTGGVYVLETPPSALNGERVLAMLKGCTAGKIFDSPSSMQDEHGMVFWTCSGQQSETNRCRDVGYIGIPKGIVSPYSLRLERNDNWVTARCGPVPIPPVAPAATLSQERGS